MEQAHNKRARASSAPSPSMTASHRSISTSRWCFAGQHPAVSPVRRTRPRASSSAADAPTPRGFSCGRPLSEHSTYGIGGPADALCVAKTLRELREAFVACRGAGQRTLVVGKGSNVLFDDSGFRGAVIVNRVAFVERLGEYVKGDKGERVDDAGAGEGSACGSGRRLARFRVGAGAAFNSLGVRLSSEGLSGLEFACGIPGTLGGAIVMNAGAHGQETAAVVESVEVVMPDGQMRTLSADKGELVWGYRKSVFQRGGRFEDAAVAAATLRLAHDAGAREMQLAYAAQRKASQPVTARSCGCIFRNPGEGAPSAGALIDRAGLKGTRVGGVVVSTKHANFLVNEGGASASDLRSLIEKVKATVRDEYGHELREEVLYIPADDADNQV